MNQKLKIIAYLTSIVFSIVLIILAVKITVNFRQLYYFDIEYLNIVEQANVSKDEIIENYDYVIDYLKSSYKGEFSLPTFAMSEMGKIHFEDVKNIFVKLDYLLYISLTFTIIGSIYLIKQKHYLYLKYTSFMLFFLPIVLTFLIALNFDVAFTTFHKLFFRNDFWLLYPEFDPIITILPQQFFMHAALLILVLMILTSILLNILYKFILTRSVKEINK